VQYPLRLGKHRASAFTTANNALFLANSSATTYGSKRVALLLLKARYLRESAVDYATNIKVVKP
jgi:hypothetical protein